METNHTLSPGCPGGPALPGNPGGPYINVIAKAVSTGPLTLGPSSPSLP